MYICMKHSNNIVLFALSCRAVAINHDLRVLYKTTISPGSTLSHIRDGPKTL